MNFVVIIIVIITEIFKINLVLVAAALFR